MYLEGCCGDCEERGLGGLTVVDGDSDSGSGGFDFGESFRNIRDSVQAGDGDIVRTGLDIVQNFAGLIPVAGPFVQGALQFGQQLETALHIHSGASEADIIVHNADSGQNLLMERLGTITDAMRTGRNPSIDTLQQLFLAVYTMGEIFKTFVLSSRFTDRRASGQALNTVMPYVDGSCGYSVPLGMRALAAVRDCGFHWGDGTVGGPGTDGMMGAIARAIIAKGGRIPAPQLTQGAGSSIANLQIPSAVGMPPQAGWIPPMQGLQLKPLNIQPVGSGVSVGLLALLGLPLLLFRR